MELSCGSRVFSFCELFPLQSSEEEKTGVWGLRGRMGTEWGAAGREGKRVTENLEAMEEGKDTPDVHSPVVPGILMPGPWIFCQAACWTDSGGSHGRCPLTEPGAAGALTCQPWGTAVPGGHVS